MKFAIGHRLSCVQPGIQPPLNVNNARTVMDLRVPPANRLEVLKGNRAGQYSIRINDHRRICFRFANGQASDVEIVDYH